MERGREMKGKGEREGSEGGGKERGGWVKTDRE